MFFYDMNLLREQINRFGSNRNPFLFGVNFELTEGFLMADPLAQEKIYFQIGNVGNKPFRKKEQARLSAFPLTENEYRAKYETVLNGLLRGNSYLTNLTVRTPIETDLSLEDIFTMNDAPFQLYMPGKFVCFSPERFIRIKDSNIYTYPMKGTIDARIPDAEQIILNDTKEKAEHSTIVDLLRNDLSMYAHEVTVKRFRYVERIHTQQRDILQVSSEISGKLPAHYNRILGDIVFSMLPAGSVSGAPKASTIRIIEQAEGESRGYYTGVFGYYDGEQFDCGVLIRFIEQENGQLFFRSGGGITALSCMHKEYREVLDKIYLPF